MTGSGIDRVNYSLSLNSDTSINLYLTPAAGFEGPVTATLDGRSLEAQRQADGRWRVVIEGIPAHKLGDAYTVRVTAGTEFTVAVSALSYMNALLSSEAYAQDTAAQNAMAALYRYYTATMAYRAGQSA